MTTPPTSSSRKNQVASARTLAERSARGSQRFDALRLTSAEVELLRREFAASPAWRDIFYAVPRVTR